MSRMVANILMCCAALFWGATFIAQKTGMETIGPMGFTFGRYVIGALALLPLAIHETGKTNLLQAIRKDKRLCVGALCLGVFMFGGIGLQQTALLYTNVANAAFLTAFYSWRLLFLTFHGSNRSDEKTYMLAHESPLVMKLPLIFLSLGTIFSGMLFSDFDASSM